jgi:hypothetical protein
MNQSSMIPLESVIGKGYFCKAKDVFVHIDQKPSNKVLLNGFDFLNNQRALTLEVPQTNIWPPNSQH